MAHHYSRGLYTIADRIQRIDRMMTLNIANSCDYRSTQRRMPVLKHHLGVLYLTATPPHQWNPREYLHILYISRN